MSNDELRFRQVHKILQERSQKIFNNKKIEIKNFAKRRVKKRGREEERVGGGEGRGGTGRWEAKQVTIITLK